MGVMKHHSESKNSKAQLFNSHVVGGGRAWKANTKLVKAKQSKAMQSKAERERERERESVCVCVCACMRVTDLQRR